MKELEVLRSDNYKHYFLMLDLKMSLLFTQISVYLTLQQLQQLTAADAKSNNKAVQQCRCNVTEKCKLKRLQKSSKENFNFSEMFFFWR